MPEEKINYAPETCALCGGDGHYPSYGSICPACRGQGSVLVAQPARRCALCEGDGHYPSYGSICRACGGTGWAHALRP